MPRNASLSVRLVVVEFTDSHYILNYWKYIYIYIFRLEKTEMNRLKAVRETGVSRLHMVDQLNAPLKPREHQRSMVPRVLRETLNWSPIFFEK